MRVCIGLPYDPERARGLLADAGYLSGCHWPAINALIGSRLHPIEYLQAQWRDNLGVEIPWQVLETPAYYGRLYSREPPHLHLHGWLVAYPDPDDLLRVGMNDARHYNRWRNETYDRLVEQARRALDQGKRIRLYQRADQILVEDAVLIPLVYGRCHGLVKPWVSSYPTSGIQANFWQDVVIEPH